MIWRNDIGLSLHGAGHKSTDEVAPGNDVDDKSWQCGEDRAGEMHVVFLHARRRVDEIVERDRHRCAAEPRERGAEQEVVPDVGEMIINPTKENIHYLMNYILFYGSKDSLIVKKGRRYPITTPQIRKFQTNKKPLL